MSELITCGTYYRPHGDTSTEGALEQQVVLDVSRGVVEQSAEFPTMTFRAIFLSDGGEPASVSVTVASSDEAVLASVLYQLGTPPFKDIDFAGGHGFTGLHYVNHAGAQLQFWCEAD